MSLYCPHHLLQRLFSLPVPLNCFSCNRTQAQEVLNISDEESGTFNIMWLQSVLWSSWNNIWWGFNRLFLWHLNVMHQTKTPFISFVFHLYITGKRTGKTLNQWVFFFSSSLLLFPIFWVVFNWLVGGIFVCCFGLILIFLHQRKNKGIISHSYFVLVIVILAHSFLLEYEQHEKREQPATTFLTLEHRAYENVWWDKQVITMTFKTESVSSEGISAYWLKILDQIIWNFGTSKIRIRAWILYSQYFYLLLMLSPKFLFIVRN